MRIEISRPNKPVNSFIFRQETGFDLICIEDKFYLQGDATEEELQTAYDAHNPSMPSVEDKLASVGLSVDNLKEALGL